jgi:hypothetical protein
MPSAVRIGVDIGTNKRHLLQLPRAPHPLPDGFAEHGKVVRAGRKLATWSTLLQKEPGEGEDEPNHGCEEHHRCVAANEVYVAVDGDDDAGSDSQRKHCAQRRDGERDVGNLEVLQVKQLLVLDDGGPTVSNGLLGRLHCRQIPGESGECGWPSVGREANRSGRLPVE